MGKDTLIIMENLIKKIKLIKDKNKINIITIDGITCSGKTIFAKKLKNLLKKKFSILLISKDIFLHTRNKRIEITNQLKNKNFFNQNELHYNTKKIDKVLNFLINGGSKKLVLKNLYNRINGKNNLTKEFIFKKKRLIIFEGIYSNLNFLKLTKPIIKILIIEKVYISLFRKIERIRDKKISIQKVVDEFLKIHLTSFLKYLEKTNFNYFFENTNNKLNTSNKLKKRQILFIKKFILKHKK